jgi:hypothetical protein
MEPKYLSADGTLPTDDHIFGAAAFLGDCPQLLGHLLLHEMLIEKWIPAERYPRAPPPSSDKILNF